LSVQRTIRTYLIDRLLQPVYTKQALRTRQPAWKAGCRGLATRALAPRILLCRQKQAGGASLALPAASQPFPRGLPDGPDLFRRLPPRSDVPTSCWKASCWCVRQFTKMRGHVHGTWAHVVLPARGNHLPSVWRTGGEPWHPPPSVLLPAWFPGSSCPVPVPRPAASRCRGAHLGYACAVARA
jgi:hypothetical protein